MNSWKLNAFLFLFLLIAGLWLLYDHGAFKTTSKTLEPSLLPNFKADNIDRIVIRHESTRCVLEKQQSQWRLVEPVNLAAHDLAIQTLFSIPAQRIFKEVGGLPMPLGKFGLENPRTSLKMNEITLKIGNKHVLDGRLYVSVANKIRLVEDRFSTVLENCPLSLISLALFEKNLQLQELHFSQVLSKNWQLSKQQGQWRSQPPLTGLTSQDQLHSWLDDWRLAQALKIRFLHTLPVASSNRRIRLVFNQAKEVTLFLSEFQQQPVLINKQNDLVYFMAPETMAHLTSPDFAADLATSDSE